MPGIPLFLVWPTLLLPQEGPEKRSQSPQVSLDHGVEIIELGMKKKCCLMRLSLRRMHQVRGLTLKLGRTRAAYRLAQMMSGEATEEVPVKITNKHTHTLNPSLRSFP